MAATGKVLGTVTSVVGEAKATAADGTVRVLQVGDIVRSDEVITTSAAGAINIALESGKTLDCGGNTALSLHESILGVGTATAATPAAPGSVEALQQAIAAGQDPSQIAPATAAGGAPGAGGPGDGGGGTPVILEQANTSSVVTSGFATEGGTITFPIPEFETLGTEEEEQPPAVSVSVQVQVQVEVQVEVSVEGQPNVVSGPAEGGVFAVSASGDAVSLIEGTMEGTLMIPFVITLDRVFETDVQVTYQIVPASASTPSDFFDGVLTATITIPAGQTSFTVPIQIVRDHVFEANESFHVVLLDAVNATINPDADSASVTIFNDDAPPVANNDTNWAQEDTHITAAGNVLQDQPHAGAPSGSFADATDTDFEPLSVTNPGTYAGAYGTLVLNSNGSYTYTLNNGSAAVQALDSGETLTDSFGYSATDGFNAPDSATLTLTIFGSNDAPTVAADTNWSREDTNTTASGNVLQDLAHAGAPSGSFADHADSDTDVEPLTTSLVSSATGSFGSLALSSNGSYTYTLNSANAAVQGLDDGETLTDTFTYAASDGTTSTNATLTITIFGSNDAPTVAADSNWAMEESNQTATGNVLQTIAHAGAPSGSFSDVADSDVDVEPLTASLVSSGTGSFGSLVLNSNGSYTYTLSNGNAAVQALDEGETLTDTFTYAASDGTTSTNATLTITIFGSNDVPEIKVKTSEIFASGAEGTVDEAALAFGSNPSSNAEFVTGSFQVSDTDGVDDIDSVTINGQTVAIGGLVGATFFGSAGTMTITSYAAGTANFTYELKQAVTDGPGAETDVFTLTASDGTSNSAPATVTITIVDDVPSANVAATQTSDTLTVDESDLATNATANFADAFNGSSSFGADGPGTVSDAIYSLSVNGGSTGLVDTATNQAVTLAMNGGAVEGRVSNGEGGFFVVFRVSVDANGNVTLDQQRAVAHTPDSGPDQSTSLASANLVVLTRTATITDADGDTANSFATINIGTALNFEDDAPSVNVSATQAADTLTVDESSLATNATANFADNFSSSSAFGADGAGTLNSGAYSLSINAGATGLVDTATGESVMLQMSAGKVQGVISGNVVVFEVSVDAGGTVTLDQQRAVMHTPDSGPDQSKGLAAANLVVLTRTDTITDRDGDSANSSASINIGTALNFEDDAPSLDITGGDAAVVEGQSIINGTWTSAPGADAPATTKVVIGVTEYNLDSAIDTGKGTLTVNSNGTWTFVAAPNQSNPQAVTFTVRITDRDGDSASDSHTITINDGANPGVSGGQVMTVNEAALSIGTNPSSNGETDTASLTFTSGSDAIASIVFGSTAGISVSSGLDETQSITWAVSGDGRTLTGSIGGTPVIQVVLSGATGVAAGGSTGNVTVTATLLDNAVHQNSPDADSLVISGIQVVGQDTDGDTATHTFTGVTVNDDAPTLSAQSIQVERVVGHTLGNYSFEDGADQVSFGTAFPSGALVWTNQFAGYNFNFVGGKYVATFDDGGVTKTFFEITVNSNGTYDFNLVTPAPDSVESSGPLFSGITGGSNLPSYTFDSSNFGGAFSLVLTATDNKAGADTVTISATELGINGNSIQEQFEETLKLDVVQQAGFENSTVTRLLIGIADTGSLKTNDDFEITVTYKDASTATVSENYDGSGVLDFNIDPNKVVDYVEFRAVTNNTNFKVTGITLEYDTNLNPPDQLLNFNLTGVDADADSATAGFSVNVLAGTSGNDTLFTGNANDTVSGAAGNDSISSAGGNDILIGGTGMDTLVGGSGSDTYKFVNPLDASNADTIMGFNYTAASSGGDVLDLHDVLPVAAQGHTDLGTLGTYINVQTVGGNTLISVDADGGGAGPAVTVVTLQGITGVTLSQLLTNQEIHT